MNPPPSAPPARKVGRFQQVETIERYVVFVGPSGSGKSEVINSIVNYNERQSRESGLNPSSVTKEAVTSGILVQFPYNNLNFTLKIFDTRGLTDSYQSFMELIPHWNSMIKRELTKIHHVVVVIPIDRLSRSLLDEMGTMSKALESWGMTNENVLLVLNKCDFYKKELLDAYEQQLRSLDTLPAVIKNATLIRTCFMNPNNVIPDMSAIAHNHMIESTDNLIDHLLKCSNIEPFYPREAIISQEQEEIKKKEIELEKERERVRKERDDAIAEARLTAERARLIAEEKVRVANELANQRENAALARIAAEKAQAEAESAARNLARKNQSSCCIS